MLLWQPGWLSVFRVLLYPSPSFLPHLLLPCVCVWAWQQQQQQQQQQRHTWRGLTRQTPNLSTWSLHHSGARSFRSIRWLQSAVLSVLTPCFVKYITKLSTSYILLFIYSTYALVTHWYHYFTGLQIEWILHLVREGQLRASSLFQWCPEYKIHEYTYTIWP